MFNLYLRKSNRKSRRNNKRRQQKGAGGNDGGNVIEGNNVNVGSSSNVKPAQQLPEQQPDHCDCCPDVQESREEGAQVLGEEGPAQPAPAEVTNQQSVLSAEQLGNVSNVPGAQTEQPKIGGSRRNQRKSNRRQQNRKSNRKSNRRQQNRKSNRRQQNRKSNRRQQNRKSNKRQ